MKYKNQDKHAQTINDYLTNALNKFNSMGLTAEQHWVELFIHKISGKLK